MLGSYRFDVYKSEPKSSEFKELVIAADSADNTSLDFEAAQQALDTALVICEATNFTRDLVNTTPDDMTPQALGIVAEDINDR